VTFIFESSFNGRKKNRSGDRQREMWAVRGRLKAFGGSSYCSLSQAHEKKGG